MRQVFLLTLTCRELDLTPLCGHSTNSVSAHHTKPSCGSSQWSSSRHLPGFTEVDWRALWKNPHFEVHEFHRAEECMLLLAISQGICAFGAWVCIGHVGLKSIFPAELPLQLIQWYDLGFCYFGGRLFFCWGFLGFVVVLFFLLVKNFCKWERLDFLINATDIRSTVKLTPYLSNSIKQKLETGVVTYTCWKRDSCWQVAVA